MAPILALLALFVVFIVADFGFKSHNSHRIVHLIVQSRGWDPDLRSSGESTAILETDKIPYWNSYIQLRKWEIACNCKGVDPKLRLLQYLMIALAAPQVGGNGAEVVLQPSLFSHIKKHLIPDNFRSYIVFFALACACGAVIHLSISTAIDFTHTVSLEILLLYMKMLEQFLSGLIPVYIPDSLKATLAGPEKVSVPLSETLFYLVEGVAWFETKGREVRLAASS